MPFPYSLYFSSPSTLLPTRFDVRNTALDTTPNSNANPTTATALGIFFFLLAPAAHDRETIPDYRLDSDIHSDHSADDRPGYNNCIDFP